jgi:cell division transport system permease protein
VITARIASALRRTARIAIERPRQTTWTLLALTAALIAVGLAGLVADHVERWTSKPDGGASMVVYLGEDVDEARAQVLVAELAKMPGVTKAELVPVSESAARLQQALGADSQLLEGVELASLPASVEVTLAPGMRDVIAMSPSVRALRGTPGVDDVVVEDAGSEKVASTLGVVRVVAWTGAALLAGLALLIVLATIRVQLARSDKEHQVHHLLGAGPLFTLVPTMLAGALQGAVAALIAALALYFGISIYGDSIAHTLEAALGHVEILIPAASMILMFIGLGAGLGAVGGGLAGASRAVR